MSDDVKYNAADIQFGWIDPNSAQENPDQWRTHSDYQERVLTELIVGPPGKQDEGVGWAGTALVNTRANSPGWNDEERIPTYIDGHLRSKFGARQGTKIPAIIGDWTPEQERRLMAFYDPTGLMAGSDFQKQVELLNKLSLPDGDLLALWRELLEEAETELALDDLEWDDMTAEEMTGSVHQPVIKIQPNEGQDYEEVLTAITALIKERDFDCGITV